MKMRKVISAFLVLICIFTATALSTLSTSAEGTRVVYGTTSTSVKQGSTGYLYVYLDDLTNLSALNVSVYYDAEKITVKNVYNQVSSMVNDIATGNGSVNASYIFDGKGTAKKTNLFYIRYQVNSDAEIGDTYFDIVVTEAYDSALNEMNFSGSRCAFEVAEKTVSKSCSISSTSTISTSVGDEFELSYSLSTHEIASGSMNIQYDPELFEVVSVTNGDFLTGKIADVNTALDGAISISFVSTEYQYVYDIIKVRFKTLKNVTETSDIKLVVTELYDLDLNLYSCKGYTTKANIVFDESYTEGAPSMVTSAEYLKDEGKIKVTVDLEKNSHLGAGDFVLSFDPNVLTFASYEKGFNPSFFSVNTKKTGEGIIKFSIISLSDIINAENVITVYFDVDDWCFNRLAAFTLSGSGLTDSMVNTIPLQFADASLTIAGLGHDEIIIPAKAPTCNESGWEEYTGCSRCDYGTYEQIPALGHNIVGHEAKDPTCTEVGWYAYETCSRCDYTTYEELAALGHRVIVPGQAWVDPISIDNDATYPFKYIDGTHYSTNKSDDTASYFTITALYDCTLNILYATSTEEGFDLLYITLNGTDVVITSGLVDWNSQTFDLVAGDVVTISYHKDMSVANNEDTVWFKLEFDQVLIDTSIIMPAEEMEPTCTEDVVCDFCHEIAIPATGHNFGDWVIILEPTITEEGLRERSCVCGEKETEVIPMTSSEGLKFVVLSDGSGCYVDGIGTCTDSDIIIPSSHNGYPVLYIGGSAFKGCTTVKSILIPSTVYMLGVEAFKNCTSLESIVFMDNSKLTTIAESVFAGCSSLKTVDFGNDSQLTGIPNNTFKDCKKLTTIDFGENSKLSWIGLSAFYYCSALKNIEIPASVTQIGHTAFYACFALEGITIPEGVTEIGGSTFNYCTSLRSVTIPKSVTSIAKDAFYNCKLLVNINYNGTKEQWNAITKASTWDYKTGAYTIYCADGSTCKTHTEVIDAAEEATCTEAGLSEGRHCSVCGTVLVAQEIVPALGHTEVIDEGKAPTELKPGLTAGKHCSVCGEILAKQEVIPALGINSGFRIKSARLSLDSDINVVYTALIPAGYDNFYMIFTFNGKDYRVEGTDNGDGSCSFRFEEVIPQMVGDNIMATLYATNSYDEIVTHCIPEYSVRQYCVSQLTKSTDVKLKTMLSDLLVYAEKAQLYSGYKTDTLVTEGLEDIMTPSTFTSVDPSASKQQITGTADASVRWRSAGLRYENAMALYIKFDVTDLDGFEVRVTKNGVTTTYSAADFLNEGNGTYRINVRGIHFSQFDTAVTARFYRNGEQIGQTLTYSVNSYIYRNQDTSNAALRELLRATYVYGESAYEYKYR